MSVFERCHVRKGYGKKLKRCFYTSLVQRALKQKSELKIQLPICIPILLFEKPILLDIEGFRWIYFVPKHLNIAWQTAEGLAYALFDISH